MTADHNALSLAIRTAREARGLSCADVGERICAAFPDAGYDTATLSAWVHIAETDAGAVLTERDSIDELAAGIGVSSQEADRWHALNATLPADLAEALQARPELWGRVRAILGGA